MNNSGVYLLGHADFITISTFICMLSISLIWRAQQPRRRAKELLLLAAIVVLPGEGLAATTVTTLSGFCPHKLDLYICRIDSYFGYPGFHIGQFVHTYRWARIISSISYSLLGSAMIFTFAYYLWKRSEREAFAVGAAFGLNLFAAIPIYLLFPVCGPIYAFDNFPTVPAALPLHTLILNFPPNCIPSVHTSTALLVCWFLRHWQSGRFFGATFLIATIFSTLGGGEHYLFDLLCAVPYAAGVAWITQLAWSTHPTKISTSSNGGDVEIQPVH